MWEERRGDGGKGEERRLGRFCGPGAGPRGEEGEEEGWAAPGPKGKEEGGLGPSSIFLIYNSFLFS
jgi:hypothetical protein